MKMFTLACLIFSVSTLVNAQLSADIYSTTCPNVTAIVRREVFKAIKTETRIAASLVRLHFHDCFVNGCDLVLLDGSDGEKSAFPNVNSLRGFDVVDTIKTSIENICSGVVSCADILAIAAIDSILLVSDHITVYNTCLSICAKTSPLDRNSTDLFDNHYFKNLVTGKGILGSDQVLFTAESSASTTKPFVQTYNTNASIFFKDFALSMIEMGNISPLTDPQDRYEQTAEL